MKRLLLAPLLIALTGCSNDITTKTDLGEKYIVKESTVTVTPYLIDWDKQLMIKNTGSILIEKNLKNVSQLDSIQIVVVG